MTLPWGSIALSNVNTELGISPSWARIEMQNDRVRALAGGAAASYWNTISMNDLRGKSAYTPMSGSGNSDSGYGVSSGAQAVYVSCHPSVSVSGGAGGLSFLWEMQSGGGTLTDTAQQRCTVSFQSKYGSSTTGYLQCTIRDGTGAVLVIRDIYYELFVDV